MFLRSVRTSITWYYVLADAFKSRPSGLAKELLEFNCPLDPSAAPPPLFRLARTKSGWRAGAPTKIRLAAAGDFSGGGGGGIRRDLVNGGTSHY